MPLNIAVLGAGIAGRLCAWYALRAGCQITLFDVRQPSDKTNCSYVGAGMLAPYSESVKSDPALFDMGLESLALWESLRAFFPEVFYQQAGTLILAHPQDRQELSWFSERLQQFTDSKGEACSAQTIQQLEPELRGKFQEGVFLPTEAQIHGAALMDALAEQVTAQGATWSWETPIDDPSELTGFDSVIDARGLGAKQTLEELRSVRGELLWLECDAVTLNRPIRLCHPRYGLYVVPRPDNQFVVGATNIESEDYSAISVRSSLELLSAAYSLHPGFAEGRVIHSLTQCRPAFPDNLPRVEQSGHVISVNGLYRHGFLLAPFLAQQVLGMINE